MDPEDTLYNAKLKAISGLLKLNRSTDESGNYPHVQISFSEHHRACIYLSPVIQNAVIIHELWDMSNKFSHIRVVSPKDAELYVWSLYSIVCVAITEPSTMFDTMSILYEKKDT
jgi:hypothetical protein